MRRIPGRPSLQKRMTTLFSALFALLLGAFLLAAHRQVEHILIGSGADRAGAAGRELAGTLGRQMGVVVNQVRALAQAPAITTVVTAPTANAHDAARQVLAPTPTPGARRSEIWDAAGNLLLVVDQPRRTNTTGIIAFPAGTAPTAPGVSEMRPAGSSDYYFDVVVELRRDGATGDIVGYLRRFGQFTVSAGASIQRLLGNPARLKVGTPGRPVWTDFAAQVPAPPGLSEPPHIYGRGENAWVAGTAAIEGTPWLVWVGYPLEVVVGPARPFLLYTLPIAAVILLLGILAVGRLTGRLVKPLADIDAAARAVSAGNYSQSVHVPGDDEIGRLAQSFNSMTAQLLEDSEARVQAEAALRKREEDFRSLFATNPLPMWVYDRETLAFLEVNAAALRQYGYSREEFLRMRITDIRPSEDVDALLADLATMRPELGRRRQWRHRDKQGSLLDVDITSHLLTFEGRPAAMVVAQDITQRMLLEQQLRQAQKMEAVGQLAGGVAHDFNNLLTGILGYCELLRDRLPEGDPGHSDVAEIQKAGRSAADLTRQLLAFSRKQVLQPEVIDLNEVVRDVHGMLTRVIGEHIQLEVRLGATVEPVMLDRSQLEQILMNLAVNARDAMPGGGKLTIETSGLDLDETYATLHHGVPAGRYMMLAVTDSGIGMDAATKARMFEPFFTTKARGEGTGLGLATIFGIVKQSGGSIEVYSEPGRGATFKIYLPRAEGPLTVHVAAPAPAALTGTETILLVEDHPVVRTIGSRILRKGGYTVLEAATGTEALQMLAGATKGSIALLLTDLVLPDMTGVDLVASARPAEAGIRVLYTSGYADESVARSGMLAAGAAFLQKPYASRSLLQRVREVLDAA